jgi:hypothetical protein
VFHPIVPGRQPFSFQLNATFFNSTFDPVMGWGYNIANIGGEPAAVWVIEADYERAPGNHVLEAYLAVNDAGNVHGQRPLGCVLDRITGSIVTYTAWGFGGEMHFIESDGVHAAPVWILNQLGLGINTRSQFAQSLFTISLDVGLQIATSNGAITINATAPGNTGDLSATVNGLINISSSRVGGYAQIVADAFQWTSIGTGHYIVMEARAGYGIIGMYPGVDNTLVNGNASYRWSLVRGVVVTSGDLDLCDEEHGAHWTIREEPDCIVAVNRMTDQWYKMPLTPLTADERTKYEGLRALKTAPAHAVDMNALRAERAAGYVGVHKRDVDA